MDADKLQAILDSHAKWRRCEGGERAYLRGTDLRGANLGGANLGGINLGGTNLGGARGAICLPVGDPTYRAVAVDHGDKWMIASGCRWFTVDEARAHWGAGDYERGPLLGGQYLAAMDWLEANSDAIREQWT
jgi:uncharacterized protein YjbI with pentapeptide repeats